MLGRVEETVDEIGGEVDEDQEDGQGKQRQQDQGQQDPEEGMFPRRGRSVLPG